MDQVKVEDTVKSLVNDLLDDKLSAGVEKEVEEALKAATKTVDDLTQKISFLEKKSADDSAIIESLEQKVSELESEAASRTDEVEKEKESNKALVERAEKAEAELESLKKDITLNDRVKQLEELKIVRLGDHREKQIASVRDMSDEEFASYKDEMVELRNEFVAAASESVAPKAEEEVKEGDAAEGENLNPEGEKASEITTPPADIEKALEDSSVSVLNAENASVSSVDRWKVFKEGLTELLKENRGVDRK